MGTLANSVFQAMLGWIRALCVQVWTTASSPDSATLLTWIGAHWKGMTLILCAAGLILDLMIYLIRWQPYRAWRSFFLRRRNRREMREEEPEEEPMAMPVAAVSAMRMERQAPWREEASPAPEDEEPEEDGPIYRDDSSEEFPEEATDGQEPETWSRNEPEGTTAAFEQAILPRKRRRVSRLFSEGDETPSAPDELIDRYAAYRRPVYPRSWKTGEGDEEE